MVHLNRVATDAEVKSGSDILDSFKNFKLEGIDEEPEDYTATVYGSKYAAEDLPRHEMPVRSHCLLTVWASVLTSNRIARCHRRCK
jgi:glutamate decarboxylase